MKRFFPFTLLLIAFAFTPVQSQGVTEEWVRRYNGPANGSDQARALAIDNDGNIYVTGRSNASVTGNDFLTIRYNPDGTEAWVSRVDIKQGNAAGNDVGNDIVTDNLGNVYVTGSGGGVFTTIKYNPATGDTIWTRKFQSGPTALDEATDIAVDGNGNIYVTGTLEISANAATRDIGTIKYNSNGDSLWVRRFDGANSIDIARDIAVDAAGNVYIAGRSDSSGNRTDFITIKYSTDGVKSWSGRYAATSSDGAQGIAVDNSGNVYVTGAGRGTGGTQDYITVKYNSLGEKQWHALYDFNRQGTISDEAFDIATDGVNVYVTGRSGARYTTIKYAAAGDTLWTRHVSASSGGSLPQPSTIIVDNFDNVYVTGRGSFPGRGADYLTVKYRTDGMQQWQKEYNGPGNGFDDALDIGVDYFGNVYVTGVSAGDNNDYATVCLLAMVSAVEESEIGAPVTSYQLEQNYPNPFSSEARSRAAGNPSTMISFALPQAGEVSLAIYNLNGQLVKRLAAGEMNAGRHGVIWDAKDDRGQQVASGVYVYVLKAGEFVAQRKLVLMK